MPTPGYTNTPTGDAAFAYNPVTLTTQHGWAAPTGETWQLLGGLIDDPGESAPRPMVLVYNPVADDSDGTLAEHLRDKKIKTKLVIIRFLIYVNSNSEDPPRSIEVVTGAPIKQLIYADSVLAITKITSGDLADRHLVISERDPYSGRPRQWAEIQMSLDATGGPWTDMHGNDAIITFQADGHGNFLYPVLDAGGIS